MLLKLNYIYILIIIHFVSILFSNESSQDLFGYYILNSSPTSLEFNDFLDNDFESSLIHKLEVDGINFGSSENYEKFLRSYYHQYKKENIRFINAIVEPDVFYISALLGTENIIIGDSNYTFGNKMGFIHILNCKKI